MANDAKKNYHQWYSALRWGHTPTGRWTNAQRKAWVSYVANKENSDPYVNGYWYVKQALKKDESVFSSRLLSKSIAQWGHPDVDIEAQS